MRSIDSETGPVAMVLGTFSHEGLSAKIEGLGFGFVNRNLRSGPKNWAAIAKQMRALIDEDRLPIAFLYLSSPALLHFADPIYDGVRSELLEAMERTKALVFVFEDALRGVVKPFPWEVEESDYEGDAFDWRPRVYPAASRADWLERNQANIQRAMNLLTELATRRIDLLPFRTRSDVTIRMYEALDDAQSGVFLRLYVPHGRYQSEQFEDFLTLFTRFLREAEGREFSVDVERTASGTAYLFKGRGEASGLDDLRAATARFDHFLATARTDAKAAERQLIAAGTSAHEASLVVAKYVRAGNRLVLDSRHEFERRLLVLRQEMEAEVLEMNQNALLPQLADQPPSAMFSIIGNTGQVSIALGQGAISRPSILAAESIVSGAVAYSDQDRAILARIGELEDQLRKASLRSDLDRLKDASVAPDVRRTAVQRLKGFVYETGRFVGRKADEIGTHALIAYLDTLIKGARERG